MLVLLDAVARRYSVPPHEVMEWNPYQLGLAVLCIKAHDEVAQMITQRLNAEGMPVFPCAIVTQ